MGSPYEKGPRKLNLVSVGMLLGAVALVYCAVRFGPAYWTQWQLKESMRDACTKMYQAKKYGLDARRHEYEKIEDLLYRSMKNLGIEDDEAKVELDDEDPNWLVVRADYSIVVNHPVGRPTTLHFRPEVKMDATPVDWDKR